MFNLSKVNGAVAKFGILKYYAVEWMLCAFKLKVAGIKGDDKLRFQAASVDKWRLRIPQADGDGEFSYEISRVRDATNGKIEKLVDDVRRTTVVEGKEDEIDAINVRG